MADTNKQYLDYDGLTKYNAKVKAELDKKVNAEAGKGLSTNDYTTAEKEKLAGLTNYVLPATTESALGGVKIPVTSDPVPSDVGLKADANGAAFVNWASAPKASASDYGMMKLGTGLKLNTETGVTEVDTSVVGTGTVAWSDITDKPELALKSDITSVYNYKGSVADFASLPTTEVKIGDVYNTEDTDMNYAWTGTAWDPLGSTFTIETITEEQINALFTTGA